MRTRNNGVESGVPSCGGQATIGRPTRSEPPLARGKMRATSEGVVWLCALALVAGLAACATDPTPERASQGIERRSGAEAIDKDQQIEDSRLAERVREALAAGMDYKYDEVKVLASQGVVQLTGFVNTGAQRNSAEEVARTVAGVKSVANNLATKE